MRILHVITKLELGGAQQNTLHTCRELARRGHEVILAAGPGGLLDDEARRGPFRFVELRHLKREIRPLSEIPALLELRRLVRDARPDVVHLHSSKAGALGRVAARLAGAKAVVHSVHGWSFAEGMPRATQRLYRLVERACAPLTDHFVFVSRNDLDLGVRLGIVDPARSSVIRSGFALEVFAPDAEARARTRAALGVRDDEVLVACIANFKAQKAPLDFVRAAALAAREAPALRFVFAGDGELRPEVEALVRAEGLEGRLLLAGWRRDVPDLLRAADVFALTSLWEGLPRSVVQARACGLPVVATAVNGTPEVVEDGVTGFLVPPRRPDLAAAALVRLARDPGLRRDMGARAREGLAEFSETVMVDLQERLYRKLLDVAASS